MRACVRACVCVPVLTCAYLCVPLFVCALALCISELPMLALQQSKMNSEHRLSVNIFAASSLEAPDLRICHILVNVLRLL